MVWCSSRDRKPPFLHRCSLRNLRLEQSYHDWDEFVPYTGDMLHQQCILSQMIIPEMVFFSLNSSRNLSISWRHWSKLAAQWPWNRLESYLILLHWQRLKIHLQCVQVIETAFLNLTTHKAVSMTWMQCSLSFQKCVNAPRTTTLKHEGLSIIL